MASVIKYERAGASRTSLRIKSAAVLTSYKQLWLERSEVLFWLRLYGTLRKTTVWTLHSWPIVISFRTKVVLCCRNMRVQFKIYIAWVLAMRCAVARVALVVEGETCDSLIPAHWLIHYYVYQSSRYTSGTVRIFHNYQCVNLTNLVNTTYILCTLQTILWTKYPP